MATAKRRASSGDVIVIHGENGQILERREVR